MERVKQWNLLASSYAALGNGVVISLSSMTARSVSTASFHLKGVVDIREATFQPE